MPHRDRFDGVWIEGTLDRKLSGHMVFLMDGFIRLEADYKLEGKFIGPYSAGESDVLAKGAMAARDPDQSWFKNLQIRVTILFTRAMTAIRDRKSSGPVWIGLLFAFAYGALHTMGPGHGKAVVISYFVGHGGSLGRGIRMGSLIAVCHVLSAVIVIGLTSFAMHRITGHPPADFRIVRLISYAAIVGIGAFMLWRALCDMRSDKLSHGDHPDSTVLPRKDTPMGWLALAAGAVPCTGAILVLLFGLSHNLLIPAVLMVMMISLGMAMAMSGIGILAIWGRNYAERRFIKNGAARRRFNTSIKLGSASLILMIGLTLFTLTMGEKTPFQNAVARAGVSTVQN